MQRQNNSTGYGDAWPGSQVVPIESGTVAVLRWEEETLESFSAAGKPTQMLPSGHTSPATYKMRQKN